MRIESFLFKRTSRSGEWKRRLFIYDSTTPTFVEYFRDTSKERKLLNKIPLPEAMGKIIWGKRAKRINASDVRSVVREDDIRTPADSRGLGFQLVLYVGESGTKTVPFFAETAEDRRKWVDFFERWRRELDQHVSPKLGTDFSSTFKS
jgi:hypothetical protein